MKQLIPHFIVERFQQSEFEGSLACPVLSVDMSGFTAMTEQLMLAADEGAEILGEILNDLFTALVSTVYRHGGFITTFAGDAFTALFPDLSRETAIAAAREIRSFFLNHQGIRTTKFGAFELNARIGLSRGPVSWAVIGREQRMYFFRGPAIDACHRAQVAAPINEIALDSSFTDDLPQSLREMVRRDESGLQLLSEGPLSQSPTKPQSESVPATLLRDVAASFLPAEVLDFNEVGEFRNAVPLFVSFSAVEKRTQFDALFSILIENCSRFGGYLNKIDFGDKGGYALVLFGAPVSFENNVERALGFMMQVLEDIRRIMVFPDFSLRAGLSYGKVYAGIIGGEQRCEYTLIGDIVNLSARLMMLAKPGEVLVTERIYRYGHNVYEFVRLGTYELKGKKKSEIVYRLNKAKESLQINFDGALVGRTRELEQCLNCQISLSAGKFAGIVAILGEAGVGKSRLAYECKILLQQKLDFSWFVFPTDQILRKSFNPFSTFLRSFFNQSLDRNLEENKRHFQEKFTSLLEDLAASSLPPLQRESLRQELIRLTSILGAMVGLHWSDSLFEQIDPEARYELTLHAMTNLIRSSAARRPIVMLIEDGHWLDTDSQVLLRHLVRNCGDVPLMIMITSRYHDDGTRPHFGEAGVSLLEIELETLSSDELRLLAERQLSGKIDEELFSLLLEKTRANPFYAQQYIHYFAEHDVIAFQHDRWCLQPHRTIDIPASVNAVLIARIDRLSHDIKEVVKIASVIGPEFDMGFLQTVLSRMTDVTISRRLSTMLEQAEHERIWSSFLGLRYIFSHILLRDAAYSMQLQERIRLTHRLIAETIEQLEDGIEHYYADLALHYERAGVAERMVYYLDVAAEYSRQNFQNLQAIGLYDRLLSACRESAPIERLIDILVKKGTVLRMMGRFDEAETTYSEALALAESSADRATTGDIRNALGWVWYLRGDYERAMSQYREALWISKSLNDDKSLSTTIGNIGIIFSRLGEYDAAMDCFQQQLHMAEKLGDRRGFSMASGQMGLVHSSLGHNDRALDCFEQDSRISAELNDKAGVAISTGNMADVYRQRKDYDRALHYYDRAIAIGNEVMLRFYQAHFLLGKATVLFEQQKFIAAQQELDTAFSLAAAVNRNDILFNARVLEAKILFGRGDRSSGMSLLRGLLEAATTDEQMANAYYEFYRLIRTVADDPASDDDDSGMLRPTSEGDLDLQDHYRLGALALYRKLSSTIPKALYLSRLEELSE